MRPIENSIRILAYSSLLTCALLVGACDECAGKTGADLDACKAAKDKDASTVEMTGKTTPSTCEELGVVDASAKFTGTTDSHHVDYYCVEFAEAGSVTFTATGASIFIGMTTSVDEGSEALATSTWDAPRSSWDLLPGSYIIGVSDVLLSFGEYAVDLSFSPVDLSQPSQDPGSTVDAAMALSASADLLTVDGFVGKLDEADLYTVDVPTGKQLALQVEHVGKAGAVSVAIAAKEAIPKFDAPLAVVNTGPGQATLASAKPIGEGKYVLKVSGEALYRLSVALSEPM